jgi:phage baseplate assembly protein V
MGGKNILADTDFTRPDNRFKNAVLIGKVSQVVVDDKGANVRCIMPDKVDHQEQPLITKPIPVLQISAGKKRSFAMPRIGQNVLLVKLPNGTSDYAAVGFFYTKKDPPPVTDPMLDYCVYDDGSIKQFNASNGDSLWDIKGKLTFKSDGKIDIETDADVLIKSTGNVLIDCDAQVTIAGDTGVIIQGPTTIQGNITHTGNMTTSGVHTDSLGHHTTSTARDDLLQRVAALEARVSALEQRAS